jgi:hypothetical protein
MPRRDTPLDVDVRKQRAARPIFAPHRSPRESTAPTTGNHAKQTNTSDFSADFFSSLLEREDLRLSADPPYRVLTKLYKRHSTGTFLLHVGLL